MLKFSFQDIKFNNHFILASHNMEIYPGELTILCGESGSGKTTLLQELTLHQVFTKSYIYQDIDILSLSDDEKRDFIFQHMAYVAQEPDLLEDLTIEEHIEMYQTLFSSKNNFEKYQTLLGIEQLKRQYPAQLSVGEKKRVALLLAVLKDTDIIILDEPTASLDLENAEMIYRFLNELKDFGKIIIISTHDENIIKKADTRYKIEHKKLILEYANHHEEKLQEHQHKQKNIHLVQKYLNYIHHHDTKYAKIIKGVSIICIVFLTLSTQSSGYATEINSSSMKDISSTMIVYKPDDGAQSHSYDGSGLGQVPLSDSQINDIKQIPHVDSVEWRYDCVLGNIFSLYLPYHYKSLEEEHGELKASIIDKDQNKKDFLRSKQEIYEMHISTYLDGKDYANDIDLDFHQDGVYLSNDMVSTFKMSKEEFKDVKIQIQVYVPVYYQKDTSSIEIDQREIPLTQVSCIPVEVELPIAGILKGNDMETSTMYGNMIYIKRSTMENLINEYKETNSKIVYEAFLNTDDPSKDKIDLFYDTLPENAEKEYSEIYKINYQPWKPTAYTVEVDSPIHMSEVLKQLNEMGLSASNSYANYYAISEGTKSLQRMLQWTSLIAGLMIILMITLMKLNERNQMIHVNSYLKNLGYTDKEVIRIKRRYYQKSTIKLAVTCSTFTAAIFFVNRFMNYLPTSFHIQMIFIIIFIASIVEFIIPILIERGAHHD